MDFSKYDKMSVRELEREKYEVYNALQNEKIWMLGSAGDAERECMHARNADNLRAELRYIIDLINEKRDDIEVEIVG